MANIGIIYGSTTGTTKDVAEKIQTCFGQDSADLCAISEISSETLGQYQSLVLGSSTWGIGELQDDWFDGVKKLEQIDLAGKTVALFGTGDPQGYPDSFVDAVGILYDAVVAQGAQVVGFWPTEGYEYDDSKAEKDGSFVGLVIDEDNQADLTDERVERWVEQVKTELG